MVSPVNIFLNSSILAEYRKGTKTDLFEALIERQFTLCFNQIAFSESLFVVLAHYGQKSLRTLKMAYYIPQLLDEHDFESLLKPLHFLDRIDNSVVSETPRLLRTYNLLPNDTIIFAHCKSSGIEYLASYDSDFSPVCRQEGGVTLLDSVVTLDAHFPAS